MSICIQGFKHCFQVFTFGIINTAICVKNISTARCTDIDQLLCFINNLLFCAMLQNIDRKIT